MPTADAPNAASDVRAAAELEQALDRAVFAERAVKNRHEHVDLDIGSRRPPARSPTGSSVDEPKPGDRATSVSRDRSGPPPLNASRAPQSRRRSTTGAADRCRPAPACSVSGSRACRICRPLTTETSCSSERPPNSTARCDAALMTGPALQNTPVAARTDRADRSRESRHRRPSTCALSHSKASVRLATGTRRSSRPASRCPATNASRLVSDTTRVESQTAARFAAQRAVHRRPAAAPSSMTPGVARNRRVDRQRAPPPRAPRGSRTDSNCRHRESR